jgi:hypothetical protein
VVGSFELKSSFLLLVRVPVANALGTAIFGYPLSPQLRGAGLSINGLNLFDKYYLTQCTTGSGCTLGFGRTVLASPIYKW